MKSRYTEYIRESIDKIAPGASAQLESIDKIDPEKALKVVGRILQFASGSQNDGYINMGRREFDRLPKTWVNDHLPKIVESALDLSDEWEFRRFIEMLHEVKSPLYEKYLQIGLNSPHPDIREAASHY